MRFLSLKRPIMAEKSGDSILIIFILFTELMFHVVEVFFMPRFFFFNYLFFHFIMEFLLQGEPKYPEKNLSFKSFVLVL